jgi:hypothetical protein
MLLTALLHGLLGAICGWRFNLPILLPLIAVVFIEMVFLKLTDTWSSAFWWGLVLIISIEIGYFVGAAVRQLCRPSGGRRDRHRHNWLSLIAVGSGLVFEFGRHL